MTVRSFKEMDADVEAAAGAEADRLRRQHPPAFLEALLRNLREKIPRRRGRPAGTGEEDRMLLEEMAELLESGDAQSIRDAARQVASRHPGHSETATVRRLRRKFSKDSSSVDDGGEIEQYFEEEVETWDL